ncbi:16S rRNA (uracil(1498)-N(3))-methyltransferase [Limnohabitans sp.]|uniref:16S rRNA (uracil(1498)-N(3))-methyltransferase n=1 Tax=Limnohabitans sp. TaxID=1907725 RepID=UPI00286F84F8|nr:16S rRNA (uracil(1498)-N(3))-methyltransferase [Limnohabitans sp.]
MARFYCPLPLVPGQVVDLPPTAARHVQVLRMQPGHSLTLFNGQGGEFSAEVQHMGRSDVRVVVGEHRNVECEAAAQVHLAVGMPANERMDWLVEKATELGVHRITPLMTERSVIRLTGERAEKKQAHWQAVAASASEQCGRNRVPLIDAPERLDAWLARQTSQADVVHGVLSLHASTQALTAVRDLQPLRDAGVAAAKTWVLLNGPEGGLTDAEDAAARANGFIALSLGERVLRAETAALGALALLTLN